MTRDVLKDPEVRREFEKELLFGEATENAAALLQSLEITQRELARRLELSEGRISQILSGSENLTLRTLADIGWALGVRFELNPVPMSREERDATPAASDVAPPDWLRHLKRQPRVIRRRTEMPKHVTQRPYKRVEAEARDLALVA